MPKIIENAKETILFEGRKVLMEKTFKELNVREIAKSCEIGIGTFYNYFSSKEAFVSEIFRDDWKNTLKLVTELQHSEEPLKEKLRKLYFSVDNFIGNYMSIFSELAMLKGTIPTESKEVNHRCEFDQFYVHMNVLLKIEKDRGNIKSTLSYDKLSELIFSNFTYLSKTKYLTFDELFDHILI